MNVGVAIYYPTQPFDSAKLVDGFMDEMILLNATIAYNPIHASLEQVSGQKNSVHLTPNERKLLEIVLAQRGRKETIIDEIWTKQGIIVTVASYHQLVNMLRKKFQEVGLPADWLQTIPRYGLVLKHPPNRLVKEESEPLDANKKTDILTHTDAKKTNIPLYFALLFLIPSWLLVFGVSQPSINIWAKQSITPFSQQRVKDNIVYHATSSELLNQPSLMTRITNGVYTTTTDVYLASNGPKIWVAYCHETIEKDNAACQFAYFSVY
jgi:DNA-binding winged helix-turn-helix (wHTH) protein